MREVVEKMKDRGGNVDMKNVGKPFAFKSDEATSATWVKKCKNYICAGYGRDARSIWIGQKHANFGGKLSLLSRVEEALDPI